MPVVQMYTYYPDKAVSLPSYTDDEHEFLYNGWTPLDHLYLELEFFRVTGFTGFNQLDYDVAIGER